MNITPSEIIKRIRRIEIRTKRLVNETLAGEYHSMFKGRGMEFSEVREYQSGDDIRTIDWNVTARMGSPYVKKFVEERELTVHILYDASASGLFGSFGMKKKELAAEIGALLAFSAIKNNDRVGLIIFTDEVEHFIPPRKGRQHVLRVIREILYHEPRHTGTDLNRALEYLGRVSTKRSVVFMISDFFTSGYDKTLSILNRKHDIVGIAIRDGLEIRLPDLGLIEVKDLETQSPALLDTSSRKVRDRYTEAVHRQIERTRAVMKRADVDLLELLADEDYDKKLSVFFAARAARARM